VAAQGVPCVIVSSTMDHIIEQYLERYALREVFVRIYGATVEKDKKIKFRQALGDFQAEAGESLFVTDTLGDIRDATPMGIASIGVTWGYHPRETLAQGNPQVIVETPEALESALK
jgi:phosphoglycolate phosphatase